jgi:DnaJ domain
MSSGGFRSRFHGAVGSGEQPCAVLGCHEPGEFRAPDLSGRSASPNGPGDYQWLCLDHVREFNARYDWFSGMSAEQIADAQSPLNVWPSETRAFSAAAGVDFPPKWSDFHDPLDAISTRFRNRVDETAPKPRADGKFLSNEDRKALKTLGLGEDAERKSIRSAYSANVRKFHPDKNGGDRSYEKALQDVIAAYTHLKKSTLFT